MGIKRKYPLPGTHEFTEFCRKHKLSTHEVNKLRGMLKQATPKRNSVKSASDFSRVTATGTEYQLQAQGWKGSGKRF